jgi:hypothetical protein
MQCKLWRASSSAVSLRSLLTTCPRIEPNVPIRTRRIGNAEQTIGYDEGKKKYVGTWVDSMTAFMWQYVGNVEPSGKVLTLDADGPNFTEGGKLTKFQDIYEFKSADEILMTSRMLGADGEWVTFMSGTAKRVK